MKDPTGIVAMASGVKEDPSMSVQAITLSKGPDGSVSVKVAQGPSSGDPSSELMVPAGMPITGDEVFPSWAEALGFVLPIVESLVPDESKPPAMGAEDLDEDALMPEPPPMEDPEDSTPPMPSNQAVEFAGQRSYRS
jgi:hypothetical protein